MKMPTFNRLSLLLFLCLVITSFYFYPSLPDSIPTKFDFKGNPTQYSSKMFFILFMPGIFLLLLILTNVTVKVSPEKFSMPNSRSAMDRVIFGCGLLFLGIHLGLLLDPSGKEIFVKLFSFGSALFLIVVGTVFGKTERNLVIGIRVPWTIASEANWKATHRFGGKLMVIVGLMLFCISFFYSSMPLAIIAILAPTLTPGFYSYYYFRYRELGVRK